MFNFFYQNLPLKRSLVTILIVAMIFMSGGFTLLLPKKAQAFPVADVLGAGIAVGKWVWEGIKWVWEKTATVREFIATNAIAVIKMEEKAEHWADLAMQIIIETALRTLMSMLTNDIIDWVQNGYEGKPAFMSANFGEYLGEAALNAGSDFVTQFLGAGWLCNEIDLAIKIPLLKEHTFDQKVKCTLSDMGKNIDDFRENFNNYGWEEWIQLSEPKNNFYGAYLMAQTAKKEAEETAKKEADRDATMGGGFLSVNKCTWYDANGTVIIEKNGVRGKLSLPDKCKPENSDAAGVVRPCNQICQTQTPASAVSNIANKSLTAGMDRINQTMANLAAKGGNFFKPYIMAIGETMINKLITDGLAEIKKGGPTKTDPTAALPSGKKLPTLSDVPANTNKELIPVLILKQSLEIANKSLLQLKLSQFKMIQRINELEVSNNNTATNLYAFIEDHGINYTPNTYTPVEVFYLFDYFQPILSSEISWYDMCVPNAHNGRWRKYFQQRVDGGIGSLTRPVASISGDERKPIDFEKFDEILEAVSDETIETKDDAGNLIKTEQTIIQEKISTYSFSIMDLINEGMLSSESTITTTNISELTTISTSPLKTEWVDSSSIETTLPERAYSWFEWYIDIVNPITNKTIDSFSESTSQEAIDHINDVFSDFFGQFQGLPDQTANIITKVSDSIDYLENTYIPAINYYLTTYKNNLEDTEAQVVIDAEQDMLAKKIVAIDKTKMIDSSFVSDAFEKLAEEVGDFSELKVEEDGELLQTIGDKEYSSNKNFYGLIEAIDNIYPRLVTLYSLCLTGRYN